jgi:glycosyltransferase involved in cell wall biosynthesis
MKKQIVKKTLYAFFLLSFALITYEFLAPTKRTLTYKINKKIKNAEIKNAVKINLDYGDHISKKDVKFTKEGIKNIALITMIKDEDDVIYDNLVWHFCIGFRKFVIIDNNSTDNTRLLVEKFKKQVASNANVVIIDDPIIEYIQSQKTTGAMLFAHSIWPKVDWIFPVDADEFWYPNIELRSILNKVPSDIDVILTLQYDHVPIESGENMSYSGNFYKDIPYRMKYFYGGLGKVALRPDMDIIIEQGNHLASSRTRNLKYYAGNTLGLDMRHFQMRSPHQTEKKYWNGSKANLLAQELGVLAKGNGCHWDSFKEEVREKGIKQSALDRFNNHIRPKESCTEDPLPMDLAHKLFKEITKE